MSVRAFESASARDTGADGARRHLVASPPKPDVIQLSEGDRHAPDEAQEPVSSSTPRGHEFGRIRVYESRPVPRLVEETVRAGGGRPIDPVAKTYFESMFRQPFADVRIHADPRASASARAIGARAYTAGRDIVFREPGQLDLRSFDARRLLAHELTHIVQQRTAGAGRSGLSRPDDAAEVEADRVADAVARGRSPVLTAAPGPSRPASGAPAFVQRAVDFSAEYRSGKGGKVRSRSQEYEAYKRGIGKTKASSESGGHKLVGDLQLDELLEVYTGVAKDLSTDQVPRETIEAYVESLNQAFRVMLIDTVETQASYIANAYVESDQFRYMTETEASLKSRQPYQSDPTQVKIATSWLDKAAEGKVEGVAGYKKGGSINTGNWQRSFIGRGPIQVTHRYNYVQVIAILENSFEELQAAGSSDAKTVREAIDQIKTNPAQAANPKYAFLVSAAFMKIKDPKAGLRGDEKANKGNVTSWMGPQFADKKKTKLEAYESAKKVLMKRHEAERAEERKHDMERTIRDEFWYYHDDPRRPL